MVSLDAPKEPHTLSTFALIDVYVKVPSSYSHIIEKIKDIPFEYHDNEPLDT